MNRNLFSLLFLLLFAGMSLRAQIHITYRIKGLGNEKVILSSVKGSLRTPVDSTFSKDDVIRFDSEKNLPVGVYRITFGKNLFSDLILDHKNVVMQTDMNNLLDDLVVTESDENKIYYDYWRTSLYINDSIDEISDLGQKIYESNKRVMTHDLDSMAKKAYQLQRSLDHHTQMLIDKSKGMYVQKLLMAYLQPSWEAYRATANAKKYRSENDFLREHYFDHVDFADTTLLHSEVFYVLCTEYLSKYVNPQNDSAYTKAVDLILKNTLPGTPVYKYILNLLINTYEDTPWENTFVHLVDDYLLKNSGPQSGWEKTLALRSATFKKLRTGNKAPAFALNNDKGKKTDLNGISSKVVLLMFWSSTCPHCEEAMPQVKDIYKKYHPMGLEIVAVSVDTDKKAWLEALEANRMEWVNVSDLKGMVSPVVESYNAFSTPTFYLLDKDKTIIAHPDSPKELKESIEKALKE